MILAALAVDAHPPAGTSTARNVLFLGAVIALTTGLVTFEGGQIGGIHRLFHLIVDQLVDIGALVFQQSHQTSITF